MASYSLQVEQIDSIEPGITVKLKGELDQLTVRELRNKLKEMAAEKAPLLIFDLEELEFMASAGLSVFAYYHELFQTNGVGQQLKIINCQAGVMRIFKMTRMDDILCVS